MAFGTINSAKAATLHHGPVQIAPSPLPSSLAEEARMRRCGTGSIKIFENFRNERLTDLQPHRILSGFQRHGAIAQLGERLHGMQEVGGSIPPGSTN